MNTTALYDSDLYAWTVQNAQLLREHRVEDIDFEHLAEELEGMGISAKRALQSRFEVLIAHLLKLGYLTLLRAQNERGWKITIRAQRRRIAECISDSPSLKPHVATCSARAYSYAVDSIIKQVGIDESVLPTECPYTLEQILDNNFYP